MMHGREKSDSAISWEADEQSDLDRSGAGGAKGGGQGECEPAKHAPDSEPGKRVTGAGAYTASVTKNALPSHTQGGSSMPELGPYGSGAARLAAIPAGESPANRGVQTLL